MYVILLQRDTDNIADNFQVYLNIVLDDAVEEKPGNVRDPIGMVVIRGNAVVMLEVCVTIIHKKVINSNREYRRLTGSTKMSTEGLEAETRCRGAAHFVSHWDGHGETEPEDWRFGKIFGYVPGYLSKVACIQGAVYVLTHPSIGRMSMIP
jgi:hypothetical protein